MFSGLSYRISAKDLDIRLFVVNKLLRACCHQNNLFSADDIGLFGKFCLESWPRQPCASMITTCNRNTSC